MKLEMLSQETQDGLRSWASIIHNDDLFFDGIGSVPEEWAWVCHLLWATADSVQFFPKGKAATIQRIEQILGEEAKAFIRAVGSID